jgi:uncharacterized membrane protein (DUF485 family)
MTTNQCHDETMMPALFDWLCTVLALATFFIYILFIAFFPALFTKPIVSGRLLSVGLVSGIALTVFLVALSGMYVYLRNRAAAR